MAVRRWAKLDVLKKGGRDRHHLPGLDGPGWNLDLDRTVRVLVRASIIRVTDRHFGIQGSQIDLVRGRAALAHRSRRSLAIGKPLLFGAQPIVRRFTHRKGKKAVRPGDDRAADRLSAAVRQRHPHPGQSPAGGQIVVIRRQISALPAGW